MGDYYTNISEYAPQQAPQQQQQQVVEETSIPQYPLLQAAQNKANEVYGAPWLAPQGPLAASPGSYPYNNNTFNLNFTDVLKRAIKYLVEGLAVAFVAYYFIGKGKLNVKDIVLLGITAAFVFAILDTFSPTIALGARFGAGFGIGQGLFGLNPGLIVPVV